MIGSFVCDISSCIADLLSRISGFNYIKNHLLLKAGISGFSVVTECIFTYF